VIPLIKALNYIVTALLFLVFLPSPTTHANLNCNGIFTNTKTYWDGGELKKGQIGRAIIESKTVLYKLKNNTYSVVREMKKGERYRVYKLDFGYYGVGGGFVIKKDAKVLYQTPSKSKLQLANCSTFTTNSTSLFKTKSDIITILGQPKTSLLNEFTLPTIVYHNNYKNLNMISYINNDAHLIYTKDLNFKYKNIKIGDTLNMVKNQLGPNYNTLSNSHSDEVLVYVFKDHKAFIFIDIHKNKKVSGFYLISNKLIKKNPALFPSKSTQLQKSYEAQMLIVTNAERRLNNLNILSNSNGASVVARAHSKDMSLNDYFNHTNLKGYSPFDRLTNAGISYRAAGENIAVGYSNPFFAHEALMNSIGHRSNKLNPIYTTVGLGVDFQAWNNGSTPYFTENYLTQ